MLNNPSRSDITFLVEERAFFAHSCIIMARCEPLEKMLDGRMKDGSLPHIAIPDYSVRVGWMALVVVWCKVRMSVADPFPLWLPTSFFDAVL